MWMPLLRATGDVVPESLIVAKDVPGRNNIPSKRFKRVDTWDEYEDALLKAGMKHMYEVIPDGLRTPVWFFADHDCSADAAGGMQEDEFAKGICSLYFKYFGLTAADIGELMFVSSTCRPEKLSVHVKVNIRTCMLEAREHAAAITMSCADTRLRPDMSVYRMGVQQIRCVGASKLSCGRVKTPIWEDLSKPWYLHLVRRRPGHKQACLDRAPKVASPSAPSSSGTMSAASQSDTHGLRTVLAKSALPPLLGPAFCPETCCIETPRIDREESVVSCYVDGSERRGGTLVCPFAKRTHKGNRAVLKFYATESIIEFRCCDQECVGCITVPYTELV